LHAPPPIGRVAGNDARQLEFPTGLAWKSEQRPEPLIFQPEVGVLLEEDLLFLRETAELFSRSNSPRGVRFPLASFHNWWEDAVRPNSGRKRPLTASLNLPTVSPGNFKSAKAARTTISKII
jgi:hypothetical protein